MNENKIIWSFWKDIYGNSDDKPEYVPESNVSKFDHYPPDDDDEENEEIEMARNDGFPVVVTPVGFIPLKPFNNPTKVFNFWMGETNFDLTKKKAMVLNGVPGVEILDIFTRYRFRVAVGNAFKFQDVRQAIERSMDAERPKKVVEQKLNAQLKKKVKDIIDLSLYKYPYWSIYVLPNNEFDIVVSPEQTDEYNEKLSIQIEAKSLVGGILISSEDDLKCI